MPRKSKRISSNIQLRQSPRQTNKFRTKNISKTQKNIIPQIHHKQLTPSIHKIKGIITKSVVINDKQPKQLTIKYEDKNADQSKSTIVKESIKSAKGKQLTKDNDIIIKTQLRPSIGRKRKTIDLKVIDTEDSKDNGINEDMEMDNDTKLKKTRAKSKKIKLKQECDDVNYDVNNDVNDDKNDDKNDKMMFKCPHCDESFMSRIARNEHIKLKHDNEPKLLPQLINNKIDSDKRFECDKCIFKTNSEADMLLHTVNHNVPEEFQLKDNDDDDDEEYILPHHEDEDDDNNDDDDSANTESCKNYRYQCPCCEKTFVRSALKRHIYIHTSEKPYRCKTCDKDFANILYLRNHQKHHYGHREAFCEKCGAAFASKKSLSKHMITHKEDRTKPFLCDVCGLSFYDKEALKAHNYRSHLPKEARRFKCEFEGCRYTCLYHHQLLEHQKVHSDDKPWLCDQCDYTAKSKWTFKKHYRKHTHEKPFKCTHCEYVSSLSSNLTRHLRIHTGSKPFKCPYCNYSCNNHENLRKHVLNTKKHQGLFLYNCSNCQFGTNVFMDLRKHVEHAHSDIYTIDEIDNMVSSVYHKHEDHSNVVTLSSDITSEDNNIESILIREAEELEAEQQMQQMIVIHPIVQSSDRMMVPHEKNQTLYLATSDLNSHFQYSNDNTTDTAHDNGNVSPQNQSEVIIIDSNVLEAEEICVSEHSAGKNNNQIIIAFSK